MTNTKKPQILLTNDDSIDSPGLWAAAESLSALGFVHVVAPRVQQTSMGRALPVSTDGIVQPKKLLVHGKEWEIYSVGGSPAQAILHGLYEVMGQQPDLVVSGINYGENVASGITVSGTVGAALEAATFGIPALAVSLETDMSQHFSLSNEVDFSTAAYFTAYFAERMLKTALPKDVHVLKVDVPISATPQSNWVLTRQSQARYFFPTAADPQSSSRRMHYETRYNWDVIEKDSDLYAVKCAQLVSVTPLSFDLTSRVDFPTLESLLKR